LKWQAQAGAWHCSSLEFRLQAASANTRDWPPEGGTANLCPSWTRRLEFGQQASCERTEIEKE